MVGVCERPPAAECDETRVAVFREDHCCTFLLTSARLVASIHHQIACAQSTRRSEAIGDVLLEGEPYVRQSSVLAEVYRSTARARRFADCRAQPKAAVCCTRRQDAPMGVGAFMACPYDDQRPYHLLWAPPVQLS